MGNEQEKKIHKRKKIQNEFFKTSTTTNLTLTLPATSYKNKTEQH